MTIVFCASPELRVSLDPVSSEERVPSVAFDVLVEVAMPRQQARISSKERWFTYSALNAFEDQLLQLRSVETGMAALLDMSERKVMQIIRNGDRIETVVRVTDTMQMIVTTIQANSYASDLWTLHEQLRSYEKWW